MRSSRSTIQNSAGTNNLLHTTTGASYTQITKTSQWLVMGQEEEDILQGAQSYTAGALLKKL